MKKKHLNTDINTKNNILNENDKKLQVSRERKLTRAEMSFVGISAICYNWANHKKSLGMALDSRYRHRNKYLRKYNLGKFAKN